MENQPEAPAVQDSNYRCSSTIAAISEALCKAQAEILAAPKDSTNPHFNSHYADLAAVWSACRPALTKNGIAVLQPVSADISTVTVTTLLLHKTGEWFSCSLALKPREMTPQGVGSAITYGRRYTLAPMVGVVAEEDDDGEKATGPDSGTGNYRVVARPKETQMQKREPEPPKAPYASALDEWKAISQRVAKDLEVPDSARRDTLGLYLKGFFGGEPPKDPALNVAALKVLDKAALEDTILIKEQIRNSPEALGKFLARKDENAA